MGEILFELGSLLASLPTLTSCVALGANNLSPCLGTPMGARSLSYPEALVLGSVIVVVLAGLFLKGDKLSRVNDRNHIYLKLQLAIRRHDLQSSWLR